MARTVSFSLMKTNLLWGLIFLISSFLYFLLSDGMSFSMFCITSIILLLYLALTSRLLNMYSYTNNEIVIEKAILSTKRIVYEYNSVNRVELHSSPAGLNVHIFEVSGKERIFGTSGSNYNDLLIMVGFIMSRISDRNIKV